MQALHLHLFADGLSTWLPSGLAGGIGMIRNWMFTLFYVSSELWGDIVLSLLFWGLANETTTLHEASLLYPLFGVGANIGQVLPFPAWAALTGHVQLGCWCSRGCPFIASHPYLRQLMSLLVPRCSV